MADVDIDPFGEHESRTDDSTETGENIPFTPVGGGRSTWEPERGEQETSCWRRISKNQTNERLC